MNKADNIKPNKTFIPFLVLLVASGVFASDAYIPFLPIMQHQLHTSAHALQSTIAIYILGLCLGQIFFGPLSDKVGRKPIIVCGVILLIFSSTAAALSTNILIFSAARILQGLGAATGISMARSMLRDLYSGNKLAKSIATFSIANSLTPAAAPVVGAYIGHHFGWHSIFWFLVIMYCINLFIFSKLLPETITEKQTDKKLFTYIKTSYKKLLSSKYFICNTLLTATLFAGMMAYLSCAAFIFQNQLHLNPIHFAWITIFLVGGSLIGRTCNIILVGKLSGDKIMQLAMTIKIISSIVLLISILSGYIHIWSIAACVTVYVASNALLLPNILTSILTEFSFMAGAAAALYGTIQMFGGALGSAVIALFAHQQPLAIAVMLSALAVLGQVLLILRKQSRQPSYDDITHKPETI